MQQTATVSRTRAANLETIRNAPALVAGSFRYDRDRRHWIAKSWDEAGVEYHLRYCLSGSLLETHCDCPAGIHGTLCKHAEAFVALIFPTILSGSAISEHRAVKTAWWLA